MRLSRGTTALALMTLLPGVAAGQGSGVRDGDPALGTLAPSRAARVVDDVVARFNAIPARGEALGARSSGLIASPAYTTRISNRLGFRNHFQGIQRLDGNHLVVSGGDETGPMSSLFVIELGSRDAGRAWGSNLPRSGRPPTSDRVINTVSIDSKFWHAGGMAAADSALAVPIYGTGPTHGKVVFYDMADPANPQRMDVEIDRPGRKAYAVAMTRMLDGRYVLAVLSARDDLPRRVDFYRSASTDLAHGFDGPPLTWAAADVRAVAGQDANFGDFQNIEFVLQSDGTLFLIGLHNTAPSLDPFPGRDYADLYEVELPDGLFGIGATGGADGTAVTGNVSPSPVLTKVANRHLRCEDGNCNLDAGSGLYVDDAGNLAIYAIAYWLDDEALKFTEFSPASVEPAAQPAR